MSEYIGGSKLVRAKLTRPFSGYPVGTEVTVTVYDELVTPQMKLPDGRGWFATNDFEVIAGGATEENPMKYSTDPDDYKNRSCWDNYELIEQLKGELDDAKFMLTKAQHAKMKAEFDRNESYKRERGYLDEIAKLEAVLPVASEGNYEQQYNRVMSLLRSTKMNHGLCQPRERRACTNCNAVDDLDKLIADYKGARIVAMEAALPGAAEKEASRG